MQWQQTRMQTSGISSLLENYCEGKHSFDDSAILQWNYFFKGTRVNYSVQRKNGKRSKNLRKTQVLPWPQAQESSTQKLGQCFKDVHLKQIMKTKGYRVITENYWTSLVKTEGFNVSVFSLARSRQLIHQRVQTWAGIRKIGLYGTELVIVILIW